MTADTLPSIQSVERALDILEYVGAQSDAQRGADIAAALGLHKNTAHNLIRTLFHRKYLAQLPDSRYLLGEAVHALASPHDPWEALCRQAAPVLQALAHDTGDCAFLGVLAQGRLRCIALAEGTGAIRVSVNQQWEEQLHCTAAGKALLAWEPEALEAFLARPDALVRRTPETIVDPAALRRNIAAARKAGYTTVCNESVEDVASLGVPIFRQDSRFVGALAQSFPAYRLEGGRLDVKARVKRLQQDAAAIARQMCGQSE